MLITIGHTTFCLLLVLLLIILIKLYARKPIVRRKDSPFECGFDPYERARLPFSIRFFILAIIFLIFDIEVAILFPVIITRKKIILKTSFLAGGVFLNILIIGLIHE